MSRTNKETEKVTKKLFVLDTNVLLHDPACIHRFDEHAVFIPVDVLSELDRFKNEMTERGSNAREIHRELLKLFGKDSITQGVATNGGGTLQILVCDPYADKAAYPLLEKFSSIFKHDEKMDHRIIASAIWLQYKHQEAGNVEVTLVSKDLNMQLKARAVGLTCEDYLHDKVSKCPTNDYEIPAFTVSSHELQRFSSSGNLQIADADRVEGLYINNYVLLTGPSGTIPARFVANNTFVKLYNTPESIKVGPGATIKPMNLGQHCLLDALYDPNISLITCYGQAGTGKTLLSVAAALDQAINMNSYQGVTISRPIVAMGQGVGFLPGTLQEKMRPWLQPIYDALDLLMRPIKNKQGPARKTAKKILRPEDVTPAAPLYESLITQGVIEIEALCYIRGRSIPSRFFILDEAQQLTPLEVKTVITRMSKGSKLVLIGDPAQIDNPYVDSRSNGLAFASQRLKGQTFSAHIPLSKGERSELAEAGAKLL